MCHSSSIYFCIGPAYFAMFWFHLLVHAYILAVLVSLASVAVVTMPCVVVIILVLLSTLTLIPVILTFVICQYYSSYIVEIILAFILFFLHCHLLVL